ncbi:GH25 family lysozyme [Mycobacterium sp. CVI_P3]|uniref:GH25 family lysozyme n=1 Tax=Mycobacterium pinniadriaticum TaxID=2994102 RepID=A0ABT3SDK9_9MYCO|nr:GH25 family lysozyme [Mycobacterium pinniadriaticum]MCX2931187.1 GH25 family lysozyme [Mycobacterium pinniadriaticum]MCX2937589.1 GH25 family lysozyme [Mycobacterium pinniadriaticum]
MTAVRRDPGVLTDVLGDRMAKFLERYPKAGEISIASGKDGAHGALSHHYGLHYLGSPTAALDVTAADKEKRRDFAKWLYDNYSDHTVELIHSSRTADGGGFYVKNQKRYPGGGIYGGPEAIDHYDHVHWATSADLLQDLERPAGEQPAIAAADIPQDVAPVSPAPGEPADLVGIANTAPVWGWDASNLDWERGPMDLVAAQGDGISFFTHKATEGGDWKDSHYKDALDRARAAAIPVLGTYHYLKPGDIEAQVKFWMDYVDEQTPWWKTVPWIWQIDAEKENVPRPPTPEEIGQAVQAVRRRMATQGTTGYVIVYAPRSVYQNSLDAGYDVWGSDYRGSGAARAFKEQYQGVTDCAAGWSLMSGRKPRILQFASNGKVGRQESCCVDKFDGDLHTLIELCGRDPGFIGAPAARVAVTEKVLSYDHAIVPQDTYYDCGPAATQVVLNSLGINVAEHVLCNEIGTTRSGTNCVQMIEAALDRRLPNARYTSVEMPNDPPTAAQREALWANIVGSIDAGYGVIMNWDAPVSNYPRGVKGSVNPSYHGGEVFHYVACMGYDSNPALRAVWIADSGFRPFGYWISIEQAASLIPRKAYAYAAATSVSPITITPKPSQVPVAQGGAETLSQAMGASLPLDRYRALLPAVTSALQACGCVTADPATTINRIAMWMAQVGHESVGLKYMTELGDDDYFRKYNNRPDLGNGPTDGPRFRGRGPIQVTGRLNYTELSRWAHTRGLAPSPTFFVDDPDQLASDVYGFIGVIWYWTVARNMNSFADNADIEGGSVAVNGRNSVTGRANGIEDRIARWSRCRDIGTALLTLTGPPETGQISIPNAPEIKDPAAGVDANGWPLPWRFAYSRHPRDFNQIVNDPERGPWNRRQPDGTQHDGHTDAFEQIVPINEQIAWTHVFSDGIKRDSGDVLLELMEFAIAWRKANNLPTSAFPPANPPGPVDTGLAPTPVDAGLNSPPGGFIAAVTDNGEPATTRPSKRSANSVKSQPTKAAKKRTAKPAKKETSAPPKANGTR